MRLKLDEAGHVVVQDGKPVYIADDNKEIAFDAAATVATITRLNGESRSHREAKEAAVAALKPFEGMDPVAAKRAIDLAKNLDDKKLIDAGEAERVKAETISAIEAKYAPVLQENETLRTSLHNEMIGGSFTRSKFISEKVAIPADLMEARFGKNFKIDGGKVVSVDNSGNQIYSRSKPGELADFEEALSILVESYPNRDHILKGNNNGGGGTRPGQGGSVAKTLTRQEYNNLPADQQHAKVMKEGFTVVDA